MNMTSLLPRLILLAAVSTLAFSNLAMAQATGGPSAAETTPPGANRAPEQAAIDACKDKKAGDRVRFTDAKGKKRHWACATPSPRVRAWPRPRPRRRRSRQHLRGWRAPRIQPSIPHATDR
jgi:hypothetical protein